MGNQEGTTTRLGAFCFYLSYENISGRKKSTKSESSCCDSYFVDFYF